MEVEGIESPPESSLKFQVTECLHQSPKLCFAGFFIDLCDWLAPSIHSKNNFWTLIINQAPHWAGMSRTRSLLGELSPDFQECGTSGSSITWEIVKNAHFQASSQTSVIKICIFSKIPGRFLSILKFKKHWPNRFLAGERETLFGFLILPFILLVFIDHLSSGLGLGAGGPWVSKTKEMLMA